MAKSQVGDISFCMSKTNQITAYELLPIGTQVHVQNKIGEIIKAEFVESSNNFGKICSHTVKFTHKKEKGFGSTFKVVALKKEIVQAVNYSFINYKL